jgi:hypothetical protein
MNWRWEWRHIRNWRKLFDSVRQWRWNVASWWRWRGWRKVSHWWRWRRRWWKTNDSLGHHLHFLLVSILINLGHSLLVLLELLLLINFTLFEHLLFLSIKLVLFIFSITHVYNSGIVVLPVLL